MLDTDIASLDMAHPCLSMPQQQLSTEDQVLCAYSSSADRATLRAPTKDLVVEWNNLSDALSANFLDNLTASLWDSLWVSLLDSLLHNLQHRLPHHPPLMDP